MEGGEGSAGPGSPWEPPALCPGETSTGMVSQHRELTQLRCFWSCSGCEEDSAMRRKREEGREGAQGSTDIPTPLTSELQVVQGRVCLQGEEIQGAIQPCSHNPGGEMGSEERPLPEPQNQTLPGPSTEHPLPGRSCKELGWETGHSSRWAGQGQCLWNNSDPKLSQP